MLQPTCTSKWTRFHEWLVGCVRVDMRKWGIAENIFKVIESFFFFLWIAESYEHALSVSCYRIFFLGFFNAWLIHIDKKNTMVRLDYGAYCNCFFNFCMPCAKLDLVKIDSIIKNNKGRFRQVFPYIHLRKEKKN